jgi:hypothetical protein
MRASTLRAILTKISSPSHPLFRRLFDLDQTEWPELCRAVTSMTAE